MAGKRSPRRRSEDKPEIGMAKEQENKIVVELVSGVREKYAKGA